MNANMATIGVPPLVSDYVYADHGVWPMRYVTT